MRITSQLTTPVARATSPPSPSAPQEPTDGYASGRDYPSWLIPATLVGGVGVCAGMSLLATVAEPVAGAVALTAGVGTAVACWRSAEGGAEAPLGLLVGIGVGGAVGAVGGLGASVGRQLAGTLGGPVVASLAGGAAVAVGAAAFCFVCNQA